MNQGPFTAILADENAVRELVGQPMELAVKKSLPKLDRYCREFVERSPFLTLATANDKGKADVSPRGDQPGFVLILDDQTLFIPERPGNKRADSLTNITLNPNVGLLFLVPGFDETLRVNGRATVVNDPALLERCAVKGKVPKLGVLVAVEEAYLHCAKAFRRAKLWDSESRQVRSEMPTLGKMILEQTAAANKPPSGAEVKVVDEFVEDNYRNELY
ncbi:MAG: pyridoxamine 5'-phosphate oxidase family protein [Proteobacteria bacterium]|nr:MAG: pyridoxamine 5'-phosphate oxidase family protein [Pseudomonadota bacterium]